MLDDDSRFESAGRSFGRRRRVLQGEKLTMVELGSLWRITGGCTSTTITGIRIVLRGIALSFE
jgi:hypothetical protein